MSYQYTFVPGPTKPDPSVLAQYGLYFGASDVEQQEFAKDYDECTSKFRQILHIPSSSSIIILPGEGMIGLWAGLSNILNPGDAVLSISSGLFGAGIGEMAEQKGAKAHYFNINNQSVFNQKDHGESFTKMIKEVHPKMVTAVHCETPCGTLIDQKDLEFLSRTCRESGALFYLDSVSCAFGCDMDLTKAPADICLIGSQKCLSLFPDLSIVIVSEQAWKVVDEKNSAPSTAYYGYDALLPWKEVSQPSDSGNRLFPVTLSWSSIRAMLLSLNMIFDEGMDNVVKRHEKAAKYCRDRMKSLGVKLYPQSEEISSPTVSSFFVPEGITWDALDGALRSRGVLLGGNYEDLSGKVFRVGHMGTQADLKALEGALDIFEEVLKSLV